LLIGHPSDILYSSKLRQARKSPDSKLKMREKRGWIEWNGMERGKNDERI
jgi:hypothetical protein